VHYHSVDRVFARWANDGSLEQAFMVSMVHLSTEKHLDPVCSMAAGLTPRPIKGGWDRLLGL
jgi:hypothetical protein